MPIYDYAARLDAPADVYDGDTVRLVIATEPVDIGFHLSISGGGKIKFRLARVNCPELRDEGGHAARDYSIDWFGKHDAEAISLGTHSAHALRVTSLRADNYGDRWDAEVYCSCGANLGDDLLSTRHAEPWPKPRA